jgi:hypothetical protein
MPKAWRRSKATSEYYPLPDVSRSPDGELNRTGPTFTVIPSASAASSWLFNTSRVPLSES